MGWLYAGIGRREPHIIVDRWVFMSCFAARSNLERVRPMQNLQ
jgi:hypothetical protein